MHDAQSAVMGETRRSNFGKRALKAVLSPASVLFWVAAIFFGAGRWDWLRGWICVSVYLSTLAIIGAVVRYFSPGLLKRRAEGIREDSAAFDKSILPIYLLLSMIQPAVAGLDAVRYGWLPLPSSTIVPGVVLFVMGMGLITWAMIANPFTESTVRIQTEYGHRVITKGPYRALRHPMYTGSIPMHVGTGLILGSGWAVVLAVVLSAIIVWRTIKEDEFLHRELPGYAEYAARTRFRLMPGLW
jgi:protein-S-isoprenylcysteine O-methyltransferase Ste14